MCLGYGFKICPIAVFDNPMGVLIENLQRLGHYPDGFLCSFNRLFVDWVLADFQSG